MSRRARSLSLLVLPLPVVLSGCLTIATRVRVDPRGGVARGVQIDAESAQAIGKAVERFPPPWVVRREEGAHRLHADLTAAQDAELPPGETAISVTRRDFVLFEEVSYREDWSLLRLGRGAPTIAPVPPARLLLHPVVNLLIHETNLAAMERRFREQVKVSVEVELPGSVVDGNFTSRDGSVLRWDFNLRAPAAPRARSRVWRPIRVAWAVGGAMAASLLAGLARRRTERRTERRKERRKERRTERRTERPPLLRALSRR